MARYQIVKIEYGGAVLEIPDFLAPIWPHDIPLDAWPTFCGAGQGLGDMLVKDRRCGVWTAPVCFIHDVEWTVGEASWLFAVESNLRLYRNIRALMLANYDQRRYSTARVEREAVKVLFGVTYGIFRHFEPTPDAQGPPHYSSLDWPFCHPHMQKLLARLERVLPDGLGGRYVAV